MKKLEWVKTEWNGDGAEFTLAPAGSVAVNRYVSLSGLTGQRVIITPAWTSAGEYRQIWRYMKDAMHFAWREGIAYLAPAGARSHHPSEWKDGVVTYAETIKLQDLEEILHFEEPVKGSKTITNWRMFWAWITRPASHPRAWPVAQVAPEFADRLLAGQTVGEFYELPDNWGKVFPLRSGAAIYWDEGENFALISLNCPDEILGSLLSPELAAKRQRWGL